MLMAAHTSVKIRIWRDKIGASGAERLYASEEAHFSIRKAAAIRPEMAPEAPTTGTGLPQLKAM